MSIKQDPESTEAGQPTEEVGAGVIYVGDSWPTTKPIGVEKPKCWQCGIQLSEVMGYVCSRANCPCGLGSRTRC